MTLIHYFDQIYLHRDSADRTLLRHTRHQYRSSIYSLSKFVGREATLADLANGATVQAWVTWLNGQCRPVTIASRRQRLIAIARAAHESGHLTELPAWIPRQSVDATPEATVVIQARRTPDMSLEAYLAFYASRRDISDNYRRQLVVAVNGLCAFAQRQLRLCDLNEDLLNAHLEAMKDASRSDTYRRQRRVNIGVLWNAAADDGLIEQAHPRRIKRIRVRDRVTRAWTIEQVRAVLASCDHEQGRFRKSRILRREFWTAYIMASWDSGLRGCDLIALRRDEIPDSGFVQVVQKKTGKRIRFRLRPETIAAIDATFPPKRALCFPLWGSLEIFRRAAKRIIRRAGLQGSLKRMRSSSGTAVERVHPGKGHLFLGNTRAVFEKHYADAEQLEIDLPQPPALVEGGAA